VAVIRSRLCLSALWCHRRTVPYCDPPGRGRFYPSVRAPGTIQLDDRRVAVISLRTEAFIDSVENVTIGTMVREGQPLMRISGDGRIAWSCQTVRGRRLTRFACSLWNLGSGNH
jgi:hypothetical protein